MASGRGKTKDAMVTDEQLAQVEYELARNRMVEENEERMARLGIHRASVAFKDACEGSRPPKQKKRKTPSSTLENTTERRVLRSRGANESGNANPTDQPSKEITTKLVDGEKCKSLQARSSTAKENRAKSTVPHTAGSKSHARVAQEMADELGYAPRRDEVFIRTHTLKKGPNKGQHVPEAAPVISELLRAANVHPDWKEKSLKEGDLFARVVGMKEPRGRVRVLGLGPTPQDVGTPDTRGKVSTRVLVEMVARREAEHRMSTLEEQMQQMQQQMIKMQEMMAASQGGHNLEAPSSQHGSSSRQNSIDEIEEEIDGEDGDEEDGEDDNVQRRKFVANPRNSSTQQDESLIGMDVLLYAWTGPETPVAKATVLSVDPDTTVGGEPLGPGTYEVIVNVAIKRDTILPYQYEDLLYIRDAVTRSIAWPSSKMKPYKPAVSGSSRH